MLKKGDATPVHNSGNPSYRVLDDLILNDCSFHVQDNDTELLCCLASGKDIDHFANMLHALGDHTIFIWSFSSWISPNSETDLADSAFPIMRGNFDCRRFVVCVI